MRFFSGKGDNGESSLFDGKKVSKDDPALEFIGTIDTLNSYLGLAISVVNHTNIKKYLCSIQRINSRIMGLIAGASGGDLGDLNFENEICELESMIQSFSEFDPPQAFSFSGSTLPGAALDICRVFARKVERRGVTYLRENPLVDSGIIAFYNRLSSLFYVLRLFVDQPV